MSEDTKTHVLEIDGGAGDLHCMTCLQICNYIQGVYCCAKTRNMPLPQKKCENAFLMICLQRHAIEEMVSALIANKQIVDKKGNCVFCRNKKQHEEDKWCASKTKLELYLHQVDKEEFKIDKYLEKYLEIRVQNRMNELKRVQERIEREMRAVALAQGKTDEEIEHMMSKQGREARRLQRREQDHIDDENEGIRGRLQKKLVTKREETIKKLELSARPPAPVILRPERFVSLPPMCIPQPPTEILGNIH